MLSAKAKRALVVALAYRTKLADEFEVALFSKQPISAALKRNIIDAMASLSEANEVINCLQTTGIIPLSAKALRRLKVMLAGSGNLDTRALLSEMLPLMLGAPLVAPFVPDLLLNAASYGILANSAITNTGSSIITGDLGISPGSSVTGFPPGTVSGTQHIADASAANAHTDALALYTALAAHAGYVTIPSALDGQVLSAGYYEFSSGAATLAGSGDGTLTLNGSATDLFVIKTVSTLGTGAGGIPTITLTGGAKANNVYWLVGSSATINIGVTAAGATFRGSILASASVTATQAGNVDGRLIALGAAVTLSAANAVTVPS